MYVCVCVCIHYTGFCKESEINFNPIVSFQRLIKNKNRHFA